MFKLKKGSRIAVKRMVIDYIFFLIGSALFAFGFAFFIYPNNIFRDFLLKNKEIKAKSKYYVAVTRARFSVVFVFDEIFENDSFKREKIQIGKDYIDVSKYITK